MRIGTSESAEVVLQGGSGDTSAHHRWGWSDNGWGTLGGHVYFARSGTQTVRVQAREDGAIIDQIVLSPDAFLASPPGWRDDDRLILSSNDGGAPPGSDTFVVWTSHLPAANLHGSWTRVADDSAAGGAALWNRDAARPKIVPALAAPANYFEASFAADAGRAYHVWMRIRAENDSTSNDSIHLQFSDSVDASGAAVMRIGTTSSAELVLQGGSADTSSHHGWGWTENGWGRLGGHVYFAASGAHTLRVQQREDGSIVDQIVISADRYLTSAPGPRDADDTILLASNAPPPSRTVVLRTANAAAADLHGNWRRSDDPSAADGVALRNPDTGEPKVVPARAAPVNYFEMTFDADAGTAYHVWVRMRADRDSYTNDSAHVQFSDAVDASGVPIMRIGTTQAAEIILQQGPADSGPDGWGWTDSGWDGVAAPIYFATGGTHRVRLQQREDGVSIDQIVISPDTYLTTPPGPPDQDATIVPAALR
jgi:hypothetical protein